MSSVANTVNNSIYAINFAAEKLARVMEV